PRRSRGARTAPPPPQGPRGAGAEAPSGARRTLAPGRWPCSSPTRWGYSRARPSVAPPQVVERSSCGLKVRREPHGSLEVSPRLLELPLEDEGPAQPVVSVR